MKKVVIVLVLVVLIAVGIMFGLKVNEKDKQAKSEEIENVKEYVEKICNIGMYELPEFDNINKADKEWLYFHLPIDEGKFYEKEEDILNDLRNVFGKELNLNVKEDCANSESLFLPKYDEVSKKYFLPAIGIEVFSQYAINDVEKQEKNVYKVNVIEYALDLFGDTESEDPTDKISIFIKDGKKTVEIFKVPSEEIEEEFNMDKPSKIIEKKVLEQKEKFNSYNIFVEKTENDSFAVKKIEKVK